MRRDFNVTLIKDVSIGSRGTVPGAWQALDCLPGLVFLGASAARLYTHLQDRAWEVFHSGRFRFHDAQPLVAGQPAWPFPLSWHSKGKPRGGTQVNAFNLSLKTREGGDDFRRLKSGFLTDEGVRFDPDTNLRLKTAIDPTTGRAAENRLFSIHSIARGSVFRFTLEADEDVDEALFEKVAESLTGVRRLGQSRSAEYGQVRIERVDGKADPEPRPLADPRQVLVHLVADMAVLDEYGQPAPCPLPQWLGLPAGRLCLEHSFLRHRSFNPFNAALRRYEQERQAIGAGSVLCFIFDQVPDLKSLMAQCRPGLGLYRQMGMGRVRLNPKPLCQPELELISSKVRIERLARQQGRGDEPRDEPLDPPAPPDHPLAHWLLGRHAVAILDENALSRAKDLANQLRSHYENAHRLAGVPRGVRVGPSSSQWGRVRDLARNPALSLEQILQSLFVGKEAVCHDKDPDWQADFPANPGSEDSLMRFSTWLKESLKDEDASGLTVRVLAFLSRQAISLAREYEEVRS